MKTIVLVKEKDRKFYDYRLMQESVYYDDATIIDNDYIVLGDLSLFRRYKTDEQIYDRILDLRMWESWAKSEL
ncbi:hypothetical protein WEU38_18155 (plasmid) [Cyanobacterium aponinum AL20118]|uniref:Uncharacterized protein n=1 Tax=Cyanobacterium aponinum AL20115 TaxID=3090662 RepID=A0AAF0ZEW0_9CHRO|nr:hypothetical protein [Cyanobacterium aponinum]WPF90495.1 hypothetical protein SAY89_18220 [Cyanobacterium aponinum AL20115]